MFPGAPETVQVFDLAWKILQPVRKGLIMLKGKNSRRNENRNLFGICNNFKCSSDGDLGFAKTNVATYQAIHWKTGFEIFFNVEGRLDLVRSILVNK